MSVIVGTLSQCDASVQPGRQGGLSVLPVQIGLEHDPRVSDVQVLRAARALLAERGQDTENLAVAIDHIERDAAMQR